jgi:hypothetical protein
VARGFEKPQNHPAETDLVAVAHGQMRDGRIRRRAQVYFGIRAPREFDVPADKICVQMSFNDVLDLEPLRPGLLQIEGHVALGIDDAGHALRPRHVRSVRKTGEIKLLETH